MQQTLTTLIKPELLTLSHDHIQALMPYLLVFLGSILGILFSGMRKVNPKWWVFGFCNLGLIWAAVETYFQLNSGPAVLFNGMLAVDTFSRFFNLVFIVSAIFCSFGAIRYLDQEKLQYPEFYVLTTLSTLGMMLMSSALDLIVVFISLEVMSLSVYVLVGFRRVDRKSNEASLKYFILGAAASAVFLYGVALLYGALGTLNLKAAIDLVKTTPALMSTPLFSIGALLVIVGFLFKIASVPFHMWMPDVYEGAPTPVTGFMTTGLKAASFATFLRILVYLGFGKGVSALFDSHLHDILWVCAVFTMVIGNVIALTQSNLKRMLGYSSIAHTGYLLVGLLVFPKSEQALSSVMVYLASYAVMNLGAFIVLSILSQREDSGLNLHDIHGLAQKRPWIAFSLAVFLFSMAGIPPTAGFLAKYLLFYSAIQAGEIWITVIAVLCSAVSVYYYLRVLVMMYMHDPQGQATAQPTHRASVWAAVAVACMIVLTLQMGTVPGTIIEVAKRAITQL